MDYFEDTYIGRRRPNRRATPRFPIDLWNMHFRTINELMRTNNQAEVWHRRLKSLFNVNTHLFGFLFKVFRRKKIIFIVKYFN